MPVSSVPPRCRGAWQWLACPGGQAAPVFSPFLPPCLPPLTPLCARVGLRPTPPPPPQPSPPPRLAAARRRVGGIPMCWACCSQNDLQTNPPRVLGLFRPPRASWYLLGSIWVEIGQEMATIRSLQHRGAVLDLPGLGRQIYLLGHLYPSHTQSWPSAPVLLAAETGA